MIKKILIANRGEVALRVIRTCKEMGIKTVTLCPTAGQEKNFIETSLSDEYYFLEREGASGYLDKKRIIEIARKARVDAIHPGYGFLSENWRFARLCQKKKIRFIGPHFKVLKKLEDKIEAKKIARKIGVPTLPASDGSIKTKKDLFKWMMAIKPPFVLKSRTGGGGIGIRIINGQISFGDVFSISLGIQRQMATAFAETDFFLEKYLPESKHIEIQVLGDGDNFIHLGERECTIQRRFQKLLEEAPSPSINEEQREQLGAWAIKLAKELKYQGIATVEFLMDGAGNFYFMEVNPRLQVEHPITEAITGIDIVEQQIRVAQGEKLSLSQKDILFRGWAMESRINCEDPQKKFQPSPGTIQKYLPPGGQGIFVHTFLYTGQEIYPFFDSLLAKIISFGKDRKEAIRKLERALGEIVIEGVPTTIPFFKALLKDKSFLDGTFDVNFIEKSGILQRLAPRPVTEKTTQKDIKKEDADEREIAEIIFQTYQAIKKTEESVSGKKNVVSNWKMAERLRMSELE